MIASRSPLLVAALLCGALATGCGSSSSSTSGSTSTPVVTSTPAPSTTAPATTTTTSSTASSAPSAAGVAQYVAICKSIIAREPTLSASVKSKVEGICAKAAAGDLAGARTAAKEVCTEVVNASPIPSAAKEKALAACKQA